MRKHKGNYNRSKTDKNLHHLHKLQIFPSLGKVYFEDTLSINSQNEELFLS